MSAGDEQARDRIEAVPPGHEDERAGDGRSDERGQVGGDVQERAAHVQALAARTREQRRRGQVDGDPDERDDQDDPAAHLARRNQSANRAEYDPDAHEREHQAVRLRGEDLEPPEAVRPAALRAGRTAIDAADEREGERGRRPRSGARHRRGGRASRRGSRPPARPPSGPRSGTALRAGADDRPSWPVVVQCIRQANCRAGRRV